MLPINYIEDRAWVKRLGLPIWHPINHAGDIPRDGGPILTQQQNDHKTTSSYSLLRAKTSSPLALTAPQQNAPRMTVGFTENEKQQTNTNKNSKQQMTKKRKRKIHPLQTPKATVKDSTLYVRMDINLSTPTLPQSLSSIVISSLLSLSRTIKNLTM